VPGVHSAAVGIDPAGWEIVRFTLWAGEPEVDADGNIPERDSYEVLHLSAPYLGDLMV
jgi:hypothetical protein